MDDLFTMPGANDTPENVPLESEDYIAKVAKITLKMEPTWNQAINRFDPDKTALKYKLVLLPYKLKADDGLNDVHGGTVAPLTKWLWREVNPFTMGFTKDGSPSFLRSFITYASGQVDDGKNALKMPAVVILNPAKEIATEEESEKYKQEFMDLREGKITEQQLTMSKKGFQHIPDIRQYEGSYIGVRVSVKNGDRNNVTGFSKLPSGFKPDATIEKEAMEKFAVSWDKMIAKRKEKYDNVTVVEDNIDVIPF